MEEEEHSGGVQRLAYLVSQFPETYETFITREVQALEDEGFDIRIFSLKPCRDEVVHEFALPYLSRTRYAAPLLSLRTLVPLAKFRIRHPVRCVRAVLGVIRKTIRKPKTLIRSLYAYLIAAPFAWEILAEDITHIHAHWASIPSTVASALSQLANIPYSVTAHAYDIYLPNPALCANLRSARFVVTCTDHNVEYLWGKCPNSAANVLRVYHGIEPSFYTAAKHEPRETVEMLCVGRLVETKGHEYLLGACAELLKRGLRFRLRVVGGGPLRRHLEDMCNQLRLKGKVQFLGAMPHEELVSLYSEADIFVLASVVAPSGDRDGIPNVILEAMASSLPVVASAISGIPEAVLDGKTGLLVPQRNLEAMADAVEKLANAPDLRQGLGRAGRKLVEEKFDIEKNCRDLAKIFRRQTE